MALALDARFSTGVCSYVIDRLFILSSACFHAAQTTSCLSAPGLVEEITVMDFDLRPMMPAALL